jgi:hypothetical protein
MPLADMPVGGHQRRAVRDDGRPGPALEQLRGIERLPAAEPQNRDCTELADLEAILDTRVDLIPAADLKPGVRERAERDQVEL